MQINQESIQQFIRLLIECGGVYTVNEENHTIINTITGQQIGVTLAKSSRPLAVWYEGAPSGAEVVWLNPFKENIGHSPAREWFYKMLGFTVGNITKNIILKVVHDCKEMADDNYNEFPLMNKVRACVDDKSYDEINQIPPISFLSISYNRTKKEAIAQTSLFSSEIQTAYPKIRVKTWQAIRGVFNEMLGDEQLADFKYTSKILDIPETEAKLHIFVAIVESLDPYSNDILNIDLHSAELREHLDFLPGYAKLYEWAVVNMTTEPAVSPYQTSMYQQPLVAQWGPPQQGPYGSQSMYPSGPVPVTTAAGIRTNLYGTV